MKPQEPEKVEKTVSLEEIENKVPEPLKQSFLERPPFESPLIRLKSTITATLQQELEKMKPIGIEVPKSTNNSVDVGTTCKNGGCKEVFKKTKIIAISNSFL